MSQNKVDEEKLKFELESFFINYSDKSNDIDGQVHLKSYRTNKTDRTIIVNVSDNFASQNFTDRIVSKLYKKFSKSLSKPYNKYKATIIAGGLPIEQLVDDYHTKPYPMHGGWGNVEYSGKPWVRNTSIPTNVTHGLYDRHISVWASHGMYYDQKKGRWKWQRPNLFCTTEDLFTQTIVVPYLIPMLENAGAVVFSPRERDMQKNEVIVDNDKTDGSSYYIELEKNKKWKTTGNEGYAWHSGTYTDGENPFISGTARMAETTGSSKNVTIASYQPYFPEAGSYAVYVSYQTLPRSIDDAQYIVYHKGQQTTFRVNQTMGGSTWVYLGNFEFDKGSNIYNRVVVTNNSSEKGIVTTDAVRFGGGMGNIRRDGTVSTMPRSLEGARYSAQWYGAPYSVYSTKNGIDDYGDDINVRPLMTNWLGGGSVYMPSLEGEKVPFELSLAVHSDAGYTAVPDSVIGSLGICTTYFNDGKLNSGASRMMSRMFADSLVDGICRDIRFKYKNWSSRGIYDRNYSETRNPEVPSAIIETMSHQNFQDMAFGQDPNFKFTMARSIYKTILRFISRQHNRPYIVQPLAPGCFRIERANDGNLELSWTPTADPQEPTAVPTAYKVYTAEGNGGFDNGTVVSAPHYSFKPQTDMLYRFKVVGINRGGESFPTETLSAYIAPTSGKTIMIVNGFHRLSSPKTVDDDGRQGFDMDADMGVSYGLTNGWNGRQTCFDKSRMGIEGPGGLGFGGNELAGDYICGNTFDYVPEHADAIASSKKYNIVSCSSEAVETGTVDLRSYDGVDLLLGLEKNDGHSLKYYKTFTTPLQEKIRQFVNSNGRLIVSGAFIGSDMKSEKERRFVSDVLKIKHAATNNSMPDSTINGMGIHFNIVRTPNSRHYAATSTDVIEAEPSAYCAMQYEDGSSASVAYDGTDYKCISIGFPIECITDRNTMRTVMDGLLNFVMK